MPDPIEKKVQASTTVAAVSGMALWLLGKYVFKGGVPDVFASWVYVLVPGVLTFAAGYYAHHTHRPDLPGPVTVEVHATGLPPIIPPVKLPASRKHRPASAGAVFSCLHDSEDASDLVNHR